MVGCWKTRHGDNISSATICNQVLFSEVEVEPTQTINEVRMSNAFHMQKELYHYAGKESYIIMRKKEIKVVVYGAIFPR